MGMQGREIFVDAASNRPAPAPLPAGQPVDGCWFCLSNPNADVELVASVGACSQWEVLIPSDAPPPLLTHIHTD